jgi:transposase-like protein
VANKRKQYTAEFKFKAVMESFQRDTTIETVSRKFDVPISVLSRWRQEFQQNGPGAFEGKRKEQKNTDPAESPEELKKIIGELTVQNELLKKSRGLSGDEAPIRRENWRARCVLPAVRSIRASLLVCWALPAAVFMWSQSARRWTRYWPFVLRNCTNRMIPWDIASSQ